MTFRNDDTDYSALWLGVIQVALSDAFPELPLNKRRKAAEGLWVTHDLTLSEIRRFKEAQKWFFRKSDDFDQVCDLAGLDPEYVKRKAEDRKRDYFRNVQIRMKPLSEKILLMYAGRNKLDALLASVDTTIRELWTENKIKVIRMQETV